MVMGAPDANPIITEANYQQKKKKKIPRTLIRIYKGQAQRTVRAEYKGTFIFRDPAGKWRFAMRRGREGCSQQGRRHKQRPRGRIGYGFPETERRPSSGSGGWVVGGNWGNECGGVRNVESGKQMASGGGWDEESESWVMGGRW